MTKSIHDIKEFEFPSGFKSYKAKKLEQKKWIYLWDWFIVFIVALGIFMLGLLWYISGIEVASAHWDNEEICLNLDEFSNGAEFRDKCLEHIL